MSYHERNILIYLVTGIIVMAVYTLNMQGIIEAGLLDGPGAGSHIAWSVIKLIGGSIIATIVVTILVSIINAIITKESDFDASDERDKQIDLIGMKVAFISFSVIFISIYIWMLFGLTTSLAMVGMIYAMWFSSIIEGLVRLYLYRRGF